MTSPPTDKVVELLPARHSIPKQYLQELLGNKMKVAVEAHAPPGEADLVMEWLRASATDGRMPVERIHGPLAPEQDNQDIRGMWGARVKVGVGSQKGDFFLLEGGEELVSCVKFWELPSPNEEEQRVAQATALTIRNSMALPALRYQGAPLPAPVPLVVESRHIQLANSQPVVRWMLEEPVGNEEGGADNDQEEERPLYGAPWSECKAGVIAVVSVDFVDKKGVDVVLVTQVLSTDEDEASGEFEGQRYWLDSRSLTQADEKCLDTKWYLPSLRTRETATYKGWWVLAYFARDRFTKGGKLPAQIKKVITSKNIDQSIGLFQEIQVVPAKGATQSDGDEGDEDDEDDEWENEGDDNLDVSRHSKRARLLSR